MVKSIEPWFIEYIHDVLVATVLPFDERVLPGEYRDRKLIESATGRPFQTAFGEEVFPTLAAKGAALFHALICNHCFFNGNKRTAVISLDLFLVMNGTVFTMSSDEVYDMAKMTAKANEEKRSLADVMESLTRWIDNAAFDVVRLKTALIGANPNVHAQMSARSFERLRAYWDLAAEGELNDEESQADEEAR